MGIKFSSSGIATIKASNACKIEHIVGTREWAVYRNGQCVKVCDSRREAQAYAAR